MSKRTYRNPEPCRRHKIPACLACDEQVGEGPVEYRGFDELLDGHVVRQSNGRFVADFGKRTDSEADARAYVEWRNRRPSAGEEGSIRKVRGQWFACPSGPGSDVGPYSTAEEAWAWLEGEDAPTDAAIPREKLEKLAETWEREAQTLRYLNRSQSFRIEAKAIAKAAEHLRTILEEET